MKIIDKKTKSHTATMEGFLDVVDGELCLVEFDGEGEPVKTVSLADKLDELGFIGICVKIKVDEPKDEETLELPLD